MLVGHNEYMKTFNIVEAKANLSKLIEAALKGKQVLIGKRSKPLIRLAIYTPKKRRLGLYEGQGWISDDFEAPLEEFKDYE
jgi:antitoxin (DNA-binding transcriptional repressor) of toxin-antitoxin stability system